MKPTAALLLLLLLPAVPPTLANRPSLTETADAMAPAECLIETALARLTGAANYTLRSAAVVAGCGVGLQTQLAVGWQRESGGGASERRVLLGGKTNLLGISEGQTGFGVAYTLTGSSASGSWKQDSLAVTAVATHEVRKGLLLHANLGWQRSKADRLSTTLWSFGLETVGDVWWTGDLYGDDRGRPGASIGLGYTLMPSISATFTYGLKFENPRQRQATAGLSISF